MHWIKVYFTVTFFTLLYSIDLSAQSSDFTKENSFTDGVEGPATDQKGNIYAVNYHHQGTIGIVSPTGETSVFVELPDGSIGNGIRLGASNEMFVADYTHHNVLKIDLSSKQIEVFAHEPKANQPNDLAIAPNQVLYASDPNWSEGTGNIWKVTREKGFELLEENMGTTNGIEVSLDGNHLYVNESVQRKIWVYDILENGMISNKRLLYEFLDFGLDGMRFHKNGNLFVCRYGKGTVAIISPNGALLMELHVKGKNPTNITFDPDYTRCYVTIADRGCIETIDLISLGIK